MSLDYTTYLGPYLQCKVSKTDSMTTRRTCTNSACPNQNGHMNSKFCYECGSPIGDVGFIVKANKVDSGDIREAIHNDMCPPGGEYFYKLSRDQGIDIWIGNLYRTKNSRPFSFDREESQLIPIGAGVMKGEIDEFVAQYAKQIEVIEKAYGKDNVELKWGLIHYIC